MTVADAGVFWPLANDELSRLTGQFPFPTSDHRLVWVKVNFVEKQTTAVSTPPTSTPTATAPSSAPTQTQPRPPALPDTGR